MLQHACSRQTYNTTHTHSPLRVCVVLLDWVSSWSKHHTKPRSSAPPTDATPPAPQRQHTARALIIAAQDAHRLGNALSKTARGAQTRTGRARRLNASRGPTRAAAPYARAWMRWRTRPERISCPVTADTACSGMHSNKVGAHAGEAAALSRPVTAPQRRNPACSGFANQGHRVISKHF